MDALPSGQQKAVMSEALLPKTLEQVRSWIEKDSALQDNFWYCPIRTGVVGCSWCVKHKLLHYPARNSILWLPKWGHPKTWFCFRICAGWARQEIDRGDRERERIFQHKVSYATLLLILLQVTNYCILISMLPEQEGGGEQDEEGRKRGW